MPELAGNNLKGKKLGVLLTTAPAHPNFRPALALMNAALDMGARVYLYCVDDGVRAVASPEVQALKARGASLFGCAYGAHRRNMPLLPVHLRLRAFFIEQGQAIIDEFCRGHDEIGARVRATTGAGHGKRRSSLKKIALRR